MALALWTVLALAAIWWGERPSASAQQSSPPFDINQVAVPVEPPIAGFGAAAFQENCAPCHGAEGMGNGPTAASLPTPPTAFADPDTVWDISPAELFHTTKFGRLENLMPPWQNRLSDDEIWQVVYYAWSLHTSEEAVAQGRDLYAQSCAGCHGETGAGDGPEAEGDLPDFTDLAATMARSQAAWLAGWQATHPDVGTEWTEGQQRDVLEAVRSFGYVPAWAPPYRPGPGTIQGRVAQGTPGGAAVAGLEIVLDAFVDFESVATFTTTVGSEGQFVFDRLSANAGVVYLAATLYQGVRYNSQVITLTPDEHTAEAQITVYETSNDASGIGIERMHWIVDSQPGLLVVGAIFSFVNDSDRSFTGSEVAGVDQPVTVAMQVPDQAQNVEFQDGVLGGRFRQVGNIIYDTAPVAPLPSGRQIILRYTIPYEGTTYQLSQDFLYPIQTLNLLVAELPNLQVDAAPLSSAGSQDMQGQVYQLWQGGSLEPQEITVSLSGLLAPGSLDPRVAGAQGSQGGGSAGTAQTTVDVAQMDPLTPWVLFGVLALVLVGVVVWALNQRAGRTPEEVEDLEAEQAELVQRIARLDDLHALGELDDEEWQRRRGQYKAHLLQIAARLIEHSLPVVEAGEAGQ